ncbi:MAG: cell division initiation protein [Halanaerobiales bacterium]|nr:cell division initiation protein [Halanaerobiales bacterium]
MKLSPLDIYNKEFKKATFGYNVNQVDEFLEEVGLAFERLLKEVNALQDENERMKERLATYEEMEEKFERMLAAVQKTAREQTEQARKEAEVIIQKAEIKAEQIMKETKRKLQEEYRVLKELKGNKDLFKIRFRTLLESHLKMLEEDEELDIKTAEEDIAAGKFDLDE